MARYSFSYEDNWSIVQALAFKDPTERQYKCTWTDNKTGDEYESDWYDTKSEAKADALSEAKS